VSVVYLHYNGYATIDKSDPKKAGWWKVGKDEVILIDDLVQIVSAHANKNNSIKLSIFADCPGAGGAFYRLVNQLKRKELMISPNLQWIYVYAACNYDEFSFADPETGGRYTHEAFNTERFRSD